MQVRENIIFKWCTSPWELSFISVGRSRLGPQPWVCEACFTFSCLLVCNIHKSTTLDQSSHIVTLAEFCRFKYFAILLKNWDIALAKFCRSKYFAILLKNFAWVTFLCHGGEGEVRGHFLFWRIPLVIMSELKILCIVLLDLDYNCTSWRWHWHYAFVKETLRKQSLNHVSCQCQFVSCCLLIECS